MESPREPSKTPPSSRKVPEPDLTGTRLGDYQLLRRLGRGGMADVYLAEQRSLRRQVAIKVLWQSLAVDDAYVQRFQREAQAVGALVHANIVQIYEVGNVDGVHFLAQEYVAGTNLRLHLSRVGPLAADEATGIMLHIAAALSKAAERDIVHRDIKPENILLASGGEAKVADFGLARILHAGEQLELTQAGKTLGTPLYMSPEQVEGGRVDPRSDLYSLGATAFQMLAGRPPFEGDTALSIAVQHLQSEPPSLAQQRPDLPETLCRIVQRLLEKDPDNRFQSAAELHEALRSVPADGPTVRNAAPPKHGETLAQVARQLSNLTQDTPPRSIRSAWVPIAIVVVAFLIGCLLALPSRPRPMFNHTADPVSIPRQVDAKAQFEYAMQEGTERAWRSVADYFPADESAQNELYGYKAKLHLAYEYEETDRLDEALELYGSLADQGQDHQLQVIGLIGQANLLIARSERAAANRKLFLLAQLVQSGPSRSARERQEWQRRLVPSLRSDFQRALNSARNATRGGEN